MSFQARATRERFEELKKDPVLFCKYEESRYTYDEMFYVGPGWFSCDSTVILFIGDRVLPGNPTDRKLFIIENRSKDEEMLDQLKEDTDDVFFKVTEFDKDNLSHWRSVLTDCNYNYRSGNIKFCHMSLFWTLYRTDWKIDVVGNALANVPADTFKTCINYIISNLYTLSLVKQNLLLTILKRTNPQVTSLVFPDVEEALSELAPNANFDNYGLFQKVDFIVNYGVGENEYSHLNELFSSSRNKYIHFRYWLNNPNHKFYNYSVLEEIHSFVNSATQLSIARRYIHDVRNRIVDIDYNLLKVLRDLKYPGLFYVRYFIEKSGDNIDLSALLFCDILLTIKNSNGQKLHDFNGILDFAVKHSNTAYPNIDLGIKRFLPICDGGLKPNPQFVGFIHYSIIYTFDSYLLTKENLLKTAEFIFDLAADIQKHYCCSSDNDKHLDDDVKERCAMAITTRSTEIKNGKKEIVYSKIPCPEMRLVPWIPHKWKRKNGNDAFLKLCLNLESTGDIFSLEDVDFEILDKAIRSWSDTSPSIVFDNGVLPAKYSKYEVVKHFIETYYKPQKILLYPNKNVYYSSKKDLLGLWPEAIPFDKSERESFAQSSELLHVFKRTFDALKNMYPNGMVGEDYISIPYDESELRKVKDFFYYKRPFVKPDGDNTLQKKKNDKNKQDESPLKFLFTPELDKDSVYYCTPRLADTNEKVSNLPFFWCRSEECFCNMLDFQTLEKENNWRRYSLYHATEIIGYKLIQETDRGNVPDIKVSDFAVEVRQAERLYARLVCRGCGHMIFSTRGSLLNGSRFFACQNPSCKQYKVEVYLSQCSHCKRGLIDSRDSKKCENNWVICPSCLACCNDNLFNSLISKHQRNGYVPPRIRDNEGKGHNNKGLFFCPKCATKLGLITIRVKEREEDGTEVEVDKQVFGCPKCVKSYEKELKFYKDH